MERRYQGLAPELDNTAADFPKNRLIHELFEKQVARTPVEVAVLHEGRCLTYADLNDRANRLARYLVDRGVRPDDPVGICVGRHPDMVVGLLGILKAGGAYLPLDPNYPQERLQHMLADAAPRIVLTDEQHSGSLPPSQSEVIEMSRTLVRISGDGDETRSSEQLGLTPENLLYVIYTSGSTGKPKGTAMPHGAMANLIEWHREVFGDATNQRVLQFAALSFDVAFQETFTTLCTGGTLILLDEWVRRDARALAELLRTQRVSRLFLPPLMLQSLAEHLDGASSLPEALRDVITAGEQLRITDAVRRLFARLPHCRLHNHYGPTESHVVTALTLDGDPGEWPALPTIGRPISNTQIYLLDERRQPVPPGTIGEIYIGGANVARGYLGRPELTAQRFIADTFGSNPHGRLYKTGDLGRCKEDGTLEYLGRNDDQVKIRGFRVELGEVEVQLARHPQVKESAVVAREEKSGERRLVAYVTARTPGRLDVQSLKTHVQASLPEFMHPSAYVVMDEMPVNPNGKLDRRALPAPRSFTRLQSPVEAPQGEVETLVAGIWKDLLGVEQISRRDNFLALGGHSLLLVRMLERLRRAGLPADARSVFECRTLADLAQLLMRKPAPEIVIPPNLIPSEATEISPDMLPLVQIAPEDIARIVKAIPGGASNIQDIYPLTPLQEGMLFHHMLDEKGGNTYVVLTALSVSSRARLEELIAALQSLIDRHDILRTAILWEGLAQPVQVVCRKATLPVTLVFFPPTANAADRLEEWMRPDRQRMDLREAPLLRLQVAEAEEGRWNALLQIHHMVDDDVSLQILVSEAVAHMQGTAGSLPFPVPYRNHVAAVLSHARAKDSAAFFREKLADVTELTAPFGLQDVRTGGNDAMRDSLELDARLVTIIRTQAQALSVSPATLFHVAWALTVARTSARDEAVFGTVLLGRWQGGAEVQRIPGMFINTLPLRVKLQNASVRDLIQRTQQELIALLEHEQASLAVAQQCSGVPSGTPLFSSVLNYRHAALADGANWSRAEGITLLASQSRTNYPLTLSVDDFGDRIVLTVQAARPVMPDRVIGYVQEALKALLVAAEQAQDTDAASLSILPEAERAQILEWSSGPRVPRSYGRLIHELFEDQVSRSPDAPAVVCGGEAVSFRTLDERASCIARYLRKRGIGRDQLVGICVDRSTDLVVALLAALKAGGAFVPLDPDYPAERLEYMLRDAAPKVLLTQSHLRERLPASSAEIVCLDTDWGRIHKQATGEIHDPDASSEQLAYVIYTSGSTGKPKGVMVEHRNLSGLWQGLKHLYGRSPPCTRVGVNAPIAFDASMKQIVQILSGGTLYIVPQECRLDARKMIQFLREHRIDAIDCTPSQLQVWIAEGLLESGSTSLKVVLVGGEPIGAALWRELARAEIDFYNVYGPTECTVDATFARITGGHLGPNIGRPMENTTVYIVDRNAQPVPVGVAGEMYIGGDGVSRGYLNRPEQTAERFISDPFAGSGRVYRTGDFARWREDGTIEYVGRNDGQVKVRGYRIELGEIEAQLAAHPKVDAAAVIAREDSAGSKSLVAYVVAKSAVMDGEAERLAEVLRSDLRARLPDYMVPRAIVLLDSLPLTPNGKLDVRSLPAPARDAYAGMGYEPPEGDTERTLAEIWQTVLGVARIGRHDNFFDLGGHSILAMQATVRARAVLDPDMAVTWIFEAPTVAALSARIEESLRARLFREAELEGADIDALLERVAAMPQQEVRRLMDEMTSGGRE